MPTLIITVDLKCYRCSTKIQQLLCCMHERGEFEIEKIVYEKDTVAVSGSFDAENLCCPLWCKAGKITKDVKIKPPTPKLEQPKTKQPEPCKIIPFPYPYMYPPQCCPTWPCGCATLHCECHSKPPAPAKPACGCPAWSSSCHCCWPDQPYLPPAMSYRPAVLWEENPNYGGCAKSSSPLIRP